MLSPEAIAAVSVFTVILAFVTAGINLTKSLVDAGQVKKTDVTFLFFN
jgi:hypothetical protein